MTKFTGRGLLEPYSCEMSLEEPITVRSINTLLGLPAHYASNLVVIRGSKILSDNDRIDNTDEIILFLAVMGG
jgi:hypothetical protein